ncbi:Folate receptor alpha [Chelonia mydas]|uniref:Folate receptor alpha n=1 Tax=Chelonia mydas TaxID=8469 RepID=M7B581_CHEMY|nr:Folate receptor alpha [Chelonia mydas]
MAPLLAGATATPHRGPRLLAPAPRAVWIGEMAAQWAVLGLLAACLASAAKESVLNVCMDAKHHKTRPGPEGALHGQCAPWKDNACCTAETSTGAHQDQSYLYSFNWAHCRVMPDKCKWHFIQDTCLYECSPNLGPWIHQDPREPGTNAQLCGMPPAWLGFLVGLTLPLSWGEVGSCSVFAGEATGTNRCPHGSTCQPFKYVFPRPADLCEKIWSNSYKYTLEHRGSGHCIQMWFDPAHGNPNVAVAKYYAQNRGDASPAPWAVLLLLPPALLSLL